MSRCASTDRPATCCHRRTSPSARPRALTTGRVRAVLTAFLLATTAALVSTGSAGAEPPGETAHRCDSGVFCAWSEQHYLGMAHASDLRTTTMEECITLPDGVGARSFVNQLGRPVTVYQDASCSTEADFSTFPSGTLVPQAPFVVRAIQIWPR